MRDALKQIAGQGRLEASIYYSEAGHPSEVGSTTILVGIGFASYLVPILKSEVVVTTSHKDKSHVKYTTS